MANGRVEWGDGVTKENLKNVLTVVRDIINRSSEIGIRKAQVAEEQAYKAQSTAETAQSTAETAQSTAETAQSTAETAQSTAKAAQSTAKAALNIANKALPLSGGVIRIGNDGQVATLTLKEFTGSTGTQKRGIQIGGYGPYGHPILEVTHDDITIYNSLTQRRIGGLNPTELFLTAKNSNKTFRITVDDSGTLKATEVTST